MKIQTNENWWNIDWMQVVERMKQNMNEHQIFEQFFYTICNAKLRNCVNECMCVHNVHAVMAATQTPMSMWFLYIDNSRDIVQTHRNVVILP